MRELAINASAMRSAVGPGIVAAVLAAVWLSGCAPTKAETNRQELMGAYLSRVTKYDGIDRSEALILAQSQLIFLGRERDYWFEEPEITGEDNDFWYVRFSPINRTLEQVIHRTPILVTIRKANGDVAWSEN